MSAPPAGQIDFTKAMTDQLVMHQNVKQELVVTTIDKLKLCLIEHKQHLRARREWLGPAGLLVSLGATLVAADFHAALGLPTDTWRAIFVIGAVASGIAAIILGVRGLMSLKKGGLDELIDKIAARSPAGSGGVIASVQSEALMSFIRSFLASLPPPKT